MRRILLLTICATLLVAQVPLNATLGDSDTTSSVTTDSVIERTVIAEGTRYNIQVNTSNHTVKVSANHFADNKTSAGYMISLNGFTVFNTFWNASEGETNTTTADLMNHYNAREITRNIRFDTYGGSANITYNYTVPRKHDGRYLRPTLTDVEFERLNRSWGRVTVTVRSDAPYYYGVYGLVWMPDAEVKSLTLHRSKGENVTRGSFLVPVEKGEPFEGEIRFHSGNVNGTGPLNQQYEFYGRPGDASVERVPYEPVAKNRVHEYSYENESRGDSQSNPRVSGEQFRTAVGAVAVLLVVVILVAVVVSSRRGV